MRQVQSRATVFACCLFMRLLLLAYYCCCLLLLLLVRYGCAVEQQATAQHMHDGWQTQLESLWHLCQALQRAIRRSKFDQ